MSKKKIHPYKTFLVKTSVIQNNTRLGRIATIAVGPNINGNFIPTMFSMS